MTCESLSLLLQFFVNGLHLAEARLIREISGPAAHIKELTQAPIPPACGGVASGHSGLDQRDCVLEILPVPHHLAPVASDNPALEIGVRVPLDRLKDAIAILARRLVRLALACV